MSCGAQMSTTPKGPCQSGYYCPNTSAIIPCPPGQFCKWWTKEPKVQRLNIQPPRTQTVTACQCQPLSTLFIQRRVSPIVL